MIEFDSSYFIYSIGPGMIQCTGRMAGAVGGGQWQRNDTQTIKEQEVNTMMTRTRTYPTEHWRFRHRGRVAERPRERQQKRIDMHHRVIHQFPPDWFALRIWEDDGGVQTQLG